MSGSCVPFQVGDLVKVNRMFPLGHIRTPRYIMGQTGQVSQVVGEFANPEELAYGRKGLPKKMLYRVRFDQASIWPGYRGGPQDKLEIELYEHWLTPASNLGARS